MRRLETGRRSGPAACSFLFFFASCGGANAPSSSPAFLSLPERPVPGRVFLVGIDGASWDVFDDVMEAGAMPNLRAMTERGAKGLLRSMEPTASAILWTTIATGKLPRKHGVLGFVAETEQGKTVPVTSTLRRVDALWNIASEAGVSTGFVAWWVSWPAEAVRGYQVTDYAWPLRKDKGGFATGASQRAKDSGRTYPPELMQSLEGFNLTEETTSAEELRSLGIDAIPPTRGYAVRDIFLKDVSVARMTEYLLAEGPPVSLFATYFDGFDAFCHIHWPAVRVYVPASAQGDAALASLDERTRRLGDALYEHLGRIDAVLGTLVDQLAPEDSLVIVSDHGFGDHDPGKTIERTYGDFLEGQTFWHTDRGIVAAVGGPIRSGARDFEASILDVTPTVLALLGLPVGADMDGEVATELVSADFLAAHPVATVPTHDRGNRATGAVESPYDEGMLERLEALGYLGGD